MNLKKLFLMLTFLVLLGTTAFAQATIYVNNNGGVDSRTGQNSNTLDNVNGPVGTITRAVQLATDGSTISIAYTGVDYTEPGPPAGVALVTKTVSLVSTGAGSNALVITNFTMNGASKTATFTGLFQVTGTLYLQAGTVAGGTNLTLADGALIRQNAGALAAAPTFGATVDLQYDADATTGTEFPADATVANNVTVSGGVTLTLGSAVTINGILTATGDVDLGAFNLTLASTAAVAHVLDGTITSTTGEIIFSLGSGAGAYTVDLDRSGAGNIDIPGFRLTGAARTVRFANASANGTFTVTGNVTNQSAGTLVFGATPAGLTTITGTLINSSNGVITVGTGGAVQVDGDVTNSGNFAVDNTLGNINFSNTGTLTLNGNLTNMVVITGSIATGVTKTVLGKIAITSGGAIVIEGNVTNQSDIQVSTAGTGNLNDAGNISFPDIGIQVVGLTENKATRSTGTLSSSGTFTNNGVISLANNLTGTGNVLFDGGLKNSSSGFATNVTASGKIVFTARTTSTVTVGTTLSNKDLVNSSANTASTNGDIDFRAAATGAVTVKGAVSLEGASGTGDIIFGVGSVTSNSISITRNVTGAAITIAADGGVAHVHSFGAFSMTATNAAFTIGALTHVGSTVGMTTLTISGGTATFGGGASISPVTVTGNVSATGGTLDFGTAGRNLNFQGADVNVNGVAFANSTLTNLRFTRSSSGQTFTSGVNTTWPGDFTVSNTYVLAPIFTFVSGNFTVAGTVTFTDNGTTTDGINLSNGRLILTKTGLAFDNSEGYTATSGVVSLQGTAAQVVKGVGSFAAIECNNAAGLTFGDGASGVVTHPITGTLYLTSGVVTTDATLGNVSTIGFVNATTPPTIVRSAGSLNAAAALAFTNAVNVVYTGTANINTGVELGGAADLHDLTVSTAGGNQIVTLTASEQVNGTLTVNSGQTLALVATTLTINGASVVNNGDITNTTGVFTFNKTAGTTVTGAGSLPDINVVTGSSGNIINGAVGLTKNGGAVGTGDITLTGAGKLSVNFSDPGTQVNAITTGAASNLTLASNLKAGGAIAIGAGTLALSTYNLTFLGNVTINIAATVSGTGTLVANGQAADQTLDLSAAGAVTIPNLTINNTSAANKLTVLGTGTTLTISGALNVTKGDLAITAAKTLKVTGNVVNLPEGSSDITSTGILNLAPATGTLTMTLKGAARTIPALTIAGNVTLATAVESPVLPANTLTVTAFVQSSGLFDMDGWEVSTPSFTRTGGTYAGTNYLTITANSFAQGTGFSIPNLKISAAVTAADNNFTVTNNLYLNGFTFTTMPVATGRLTVGLASGTVPTITIVGAGNVDVTPTFGQGTANYTFTGATTPIIVDATSLYWPATPTTLCASLTINMAADAGTVRIDEARTVNAISSLNLTKGTLLLNTANLTLASGMTINKTAPFTITQTGTTGRLSGSAVNLVYTGAQTVGVEYTGALISSINNVTNNSTGGGLLTIGTAKTITGNLTANHNVEITANTTVNGSISVGATRTLTITGAAVVLTVNGSTGSILGTLAGTGSVNFTAPAVTIGTFTNTGTIGFVGATGQTVTVPTGGATMTNMNVNLTGLNPVLNIAGGNLTVTGGTLTFTNGIINMGANTLILDNPTAASNSGLGYDRSAVTGTNVGHVVGKIQRHANSNDGAGGTNGRFEFPTGTLTGQYRPVAITFTPSYVVGNPVDLIVSHVDANPTGTLGFPIDGGNGVVIGGNTNFYWLVSTSPSSLTSTQKFDVDFTANNIGVPYTSDQTLRIIRRQDGSSTSNGWSMQGVAANYANYQVVNGTDTTVVARTVSGQGGLILQGSRFTIGVPSRAPSFGASPTTFTVAEGATTSNTVQVTATPLNSGETITGYTKISGPAFAAVSATGLVTLTPGYSDGSTTAYPVVIRATSSSGLTADLTLNVTVTNVDRAPVLAAATATVNPATATTGNGVAKTITYSATDPDAGDVVTYSYTVTPAVSTGSVVFDAAAGTLNFTPAFADVANSPFTFVVTASSGTPAMTAVVNTVFTVTNSGLLGDVDGDGFVTVNDALKVLNYVVNPTTYPLTAQQMWAADVNNDGTIGAYDAASILVKAGGGNFLAKQIAAAGTASFSQFTSDKGAYTLPISLVNTAGVKSFYAEVQLGNNLEFNGVTSRLPEGWMMASNIENGTLKIAMAGTTPLTDGSVALINLSLKDKDAKVNVQGSVTLNDQISGAMNAVQIREIPTEFSVSQNYPNPFNPTTNIKYGIPQNARVTLTVYNILGQAVRTLVNADQEAGNYTVIWNGKNDFGGQVSSGVYIYRISAGNFTHSVKMNLLK